MNQAELNEAILALVMHGETAGFEQVLDGIRAGEISVNVTSEGMTLRALSNN